MRDVGAAAERKRRPYVSLIWCSTPSGHGNGLRPWIRNNDRRAAHEPVNLPLDCKHAHVSRHPATSWSAAQVRLYSVIRTKRSMPSPPIVKGAPDDPEPLDTIMAFLPAKDEINSPSA